MLILLKRKKGEVAPVRKNGRPMVVRAATEAVAAIDQEALHKKMARMRTKPSKLSQMHETICTVLCSTKLYFIS